MTIWKYIIHGKNSTIITSNTDYAEKKSKSGYIVFCKRESNMFKYAH